MTLEGFGRDPDAASRTRLTYRWEQVRGRRVTLSSKLVARPWFTAPARTETLTFRLTVRDPGRLSDTDVVTIKMRDVPPTPTSEQWNVQYLDNKIQVKVTSLPTVDPAISRIRAYLETGQPANLTIVTKGVGTTLNSWETVLSSSDTQWQTGSWVAQTRFKNSVGNSRYSLPGKAVTVPTVPTTPVTPPPVTPPTTHVWTFVEYQGCGPTRKKVEACSNGHTRHTRLRSASEPYRWGWWYNTGHTRNRVVGSWTNTSIYRGCGPNRERKQTRTTTWEKEQERQSHCGNVESRWVSDSSTDTRWVAAAEPLRWTEWADTGATRENEFDYSVEKQQRRTSNCGNTQTRWVAA